MPKKLEDCVRKVKAGGGGGAKNPFAVCVSTLQKSGYLKKGTMERKK